MATQVALAKHSRNRRGELSADTRERPPPVDILAHIPSSILVLDPRLTVTFANRNFLVKSRKREAEVLGRQLVEIFPPIILSCTGLEERCLRAFKTGQAFEGGELEYRSPGRPARVYFYSLAPSADKTGAVRHVMLFLDDVTEKKSLGERVREVERHLASVVESADELIASLNEAGMVMTWNSAAERILGYSPRDVVGGQFADLFPQTDRLQLMALFDRLAQGGRVQNLETTMRAKGGQELLISWRFSPMREDNGRVVALVGVGRDLTQNRRLEFQLAQSGKMAALGQMAGGIAHEIRNPLAIASSAAQIILKKGDDPELRRDCAEKIRTAATRAASIIENLLRFARPSAELTESVDINAAIDETLALVGHETCHQAIQIDKRLSPTLPKVMGNRSQLEQVFINIILNACHAMPEGGRLTIESGLASDNGHPRIEVRLADTGCGIPTEQLSRIFDPFFTAMPGGKGTGLGLSIAYSIVHQHGGAIHAQSQMGKGSTFVVSLPAAGGE